MDNLKKFSRRKFITTCSLGIGALTVYSILPGCSKPTPVSPEDFIKLSSLLTGFKPEELDKTLAETYRKSLTDFPPSKASLKELYQTLGVGDGEKAGNKFVEGTVFTDNEQKILADTIINYWYTGTYKDSGGMKVSNYQQQLAWKSTGYLIPNAQCRGTFGFWQSKPVIS